MYPQNLKNKKKFKERKIRGEQKHYEKWNDWEGLDLWHEQRVYLDILGLSAQTHIIMISSREDIQNRK